MRSRQEIQKDGSVKQDLIIEVLLDNRELLTEIRDLLRSHGITLLKIEQKKWVEVAEAVAVPSVATVVEPPQPPEPEPKTRLRLWGKGKKKTKRK